ncbi:MAG: sigma-70 family RNA polymerase sigma factor [Candidatus Eremiobacteraeota bacterium]|nr:sigma-70 family RNA polymerase sigma factor [Candidatus Eremiobacteraeota bacterium]
MALALDSQLIDDARCGGAALDRLIETVWPEAFRIAKTILRDRALAEDAAQEACAAIARGLPELRDSARFCSWSYKAIVRHAIAVSRRRSPMQSLETLDERGIAHDATDALDLAAALAALPVSQRAVVVLHYYAGFKSREIAAATGTSAVTVRFHLMLARRALRAALTSNDAAPAPRPEAADAR